MNGDRVLVELCAGGAAVSLRALGGPQIEPLTGFMGSKRRWAGPLAGVLGFAEQRPERVILVDAGPWGEVWSTLSDRTMRHSVASLLDVWSSERPNDLWHRLARVPPDADADARCAQYLWLQARAANCIPVWWDAEMDRWTSPSGSKAGGRCTLVAGAVPLRDARLVEHAHPRSLGDRVQSRGKGILSPGTIARRIRRLDAMDWSRVEVVHGLAQRIEPFRATVYLDPPYVGAPRYAECFPRKEVIEVAMRWAAQGARVLVSEAEVLPIEGWHGGWLPHRRPEALTASWAFRVGLGTQLPLWEAA